MKGYRAFLLGYTATVGLAPGMMEADLRERAKQIEGWIAQHPQQARELSKAVDAGKFGRVHDV